jgi:hypothetical protein
MSAEPPSDPPASRPPTGAQKGCATVLLGLFGVLLLLPGVCGGIMALSLRPSNLSPNDMGLLIALFLVLAGLFAAGIWLIRMAFRQ